MSTGIGSMTTAGFLRHDDEHGPASRERFDRLRDGFHNQDRRSSQQMVSKRARVLVEEYAEGWAIVGGVNREPGVTVRDARVGEARIEVLRCSCGVDKPRRPGAAKRSDWAAKGLCDELGHPERVVELGNKLLKAY